MDESVDQPLVFHRKKHIKYWLRCLHTFLPNDYTSIDTARLSLSFFTLSALDLLSELDPNVTQEQRASFISWIYLCQHPDGGFRGSPATTLPNNATGARWDAATLPSTYFALASLTILGDDLSRVDKSRCISWIKGLQNETGGFDELKIHDRKDGGNDPRISYAAAGILWFLGLRTSDVVTINFEKLQGYIDSCKSFDHGFGGGPYCEAHAGLTYCSLGTLAFIGRLPTSKSETISWLVSRQSFHVPWDSDDESEHHASTLQRPSDFPPQMTSSAGFAGRPAKDSDTCYSFWVGASLCMLDSYQLIDRPRNEAFLLSVTQSDLLGGFGKVEGAPPDILHSFLGLAALAIDKESAEKHSLKPLDPVVCVSVDVLRRENRKSPLDIED